MPTLTARCSTAVFAIGLFAGGASAQTLPRELDALALIDVGPVDVPSPCSCITTPFVVPASRVGRGAGDGPPPPARRNPEGRQTLPSGADEPLSGNPIASVRLAVALTAGTLARRDDAEAARWFQHAADQGHADAYIQLAHRYHKGIGVRQNDRLAAHWFHRGAQAGDRNAMVALGLLHAAGRGVPQDWAAAVHWWERARSGSALPVASRFIGDAYACGLGVSYDPQRAVLAYRESADAGELSSSVQLGHMLASGCVAADDDAAFNAYKNAADQGDPEAQIFLSDLYLQGRGTESNAYQAYLWAHLAERRVPDGALKALARTRAARAARFLSAFEIRDCETFVDGVMAGGRSR